MRRFVFFVVAMATSIAANAQEAITKAIDDFRNALANDNIVNETMSSWELDGGDRGTQSSAYFSVSRKSGAASLIGAIVKAYDKDKTNAYGSYAKAAGKSADSESVGYGKGNRQTFTFGTYKSRNYRVLFFRDPANDRRRTVVSFVWYDGRQGTIEGSLHRIYGDDPKKQASSDGNDRIWSGNTSRGDLRNIRIYGGDIDKYRSKLEKLEGQIDELNDERDRLKDQIESYKELIAGYKSRIADLKQRKPKGYQDSIRDLNVSIATYTTAIKGLEGGLAGIDGGIAGVRASMKGLQGYVDDYDSKTSLAAKPESVTNAEQFLSQFGNARTVYLKYAKSDGDYTNILTGIANKMVVLSKKAKTLLSVDERKACQVGVMTMVNATKDTYLKSLLNSAYKNF